jgi:hypothetical protein
MLVENQRSETIRFVTCCKKQLSDSVDISKDYTAQAETFSSTVPNSWSRAIHKEFNLRSSAWRNNIPPFEAYANQFHCCAIHLHEFNAYFPPY